MPRHAPHHAPITACAIRLLSLVWLMLTALPAPAAPGGAEDTARLARLAEQWLDTRHPWQGPGYDVRITAQMPDPRLRLPACRQEIDISLPPGQRVGARTLLQLRCPDTPGWRLLLPVDITARAEVLVAGQAIPPGTALTGAAIGRQWRDIAALAQGYVDPARTDGLRARMTIPAGAIISASWVEAMPVVRKGQQVSLQAHLGSITISMTGEAMADAAPGERVRVRNRQSGKVVEGVARPDGRVETLP